MRPGKKMRVGGMIQEEVPGPIKYCVGYCEDGHKVVADRFELAILFGRADRSLMKKIKHDKSFRAKLAKKLMGDAI
jgi:hypothetical protein